MAFKDEYGIKYSDDKRKLIEFESNLFSANLTEYSVLSGTEVIGAKAFKGNKSLRVIHLPSSIRLVESEAFSNCKIDEIHFAGNLEQWLQISWKCFMSQGYRLYFSDINLVENIIIPAGVSVVKEKAFYHCTSLQSVIFNKNITLIERDAFNKSGLKGIVSIPKSCQTIKQYAFFNCLGITRVKIPEATQYIYYGAFSACYGLQSFVVSAGNEYFYTDGIGLYSYANSSNSNEPDKSKLKLVALASGYKGKYSLHKNTISIYSEACCFGSIPSAELEIPHTVEVSRGAFRNCRSRIKAPITMRKVLLDEGISYEKIKSIFVLQDALITQGIPEVISLNPFRVLGVYCNASQREIQSNAARIKRFLEIGKQPTFKTDFNEVLPPIERTLQMVDKALSQISQIKEKLAYAVFWFSKPNNEQHRQAEDLLRSKKVDEACDIIMNGCADFRIMVLPYCFLSNRSSKLTLVDLVYIMYSVYSTQNHSDNDDVNLPHDKSLIEEICGDNFEITKGEFQILLFDKLMSFVKPTHLWACTDSTHFSASVIEHIFSMSIGKNIANINSCIEAIKSIEKKDSSKILKATKELKQKTEQDIATIDEYLTPTDVRYISIHDALADQILQSAIDSYNHAENVSAVARDVYALMQYAYQLAISNLVRNRCEDNMKVVKEAVDELPPADLESADKHLFAAVTRARNSADTIRQAIELLQEVEPHLFKINLAYLTANNKELSHQILAYLAKVSTVIANVCLNKIIEDVNSSCTDKSTDAWKIITALNQLPLDEEFKTKRYYKNVDILINNLAYRLFETRHTRTEVSYDIIDLRPEAIVWQDCISRKNYRQYIKRFPMGAHIKEAKERQKAIDHQNEECRRRQEEQRELERIQREEQRKREQKIESEGKVLYWAIAILIFAIFIELGYMFMGWVGVIGALVICVIVAFTFLLDRLSS